MTVVLSDTRQKARKAHQCMVCYGDIEPGTEYRRACCIYDGSKYTWKEHEECGRVGQKAWDQWLDDAGYNHEIVYEWLSELMGHSPDDATEDERLVWWRMHDRSYR